MRRIILINDLFSTVDESRGLELEQLLPGREVIRYPKESEIAALVSEVEVLLGNLPREQLSAAVALRWVQAQGAGADRYAAELRGLGVLLTNGSGIHAIPISEHILAFMFAFSRGLHMSIRRQMSSNWANHTLQRPFELAGARVLLVGTGAIGSAFAERATSLGMEVVGVRRHPERGGADMLRVLGPDLLRRELPEADFLVITTPRTQETEGMIGRAELELLKPSSYVINIGRGSTIRENDLIEALRNGIIAGAGLDVFETEPLPVDSPLWGMDNVIITPHFAGLTPNYSQRLWELFLDNARRYSAGERLRNLVDLELGY